MLTEEDKALMIASCNAVIDAKDREIAIIKEAYNNLFELYSCRGKRLEKASEQIVELETLLQGAISEAEFKEYKRRTERAEK